MGAAAFDQGLSYFCMQMFPIHLSLIFFFTEKQCWKFKGFGECMDLTANIK